MTIFLLGFMPNIKTILLKQFNVINSDKTCRPQLLPKMATVEAFYYIVSL